MEGATIMNAQLSINHINILYSHLPRSTHPLTQNLPSRQNLHWQWLFIPNQMRSLIQPILARFLSKLYIKMPQQVRHDQSHLMIRQSQTNAISRTHGKGLMDVFFVVCIGGGV